MDGLADHMARFRDSFFSSDLTHISINDIWVSFKSDLTTAMERFIPMKMTKTKHNVPWIDNKIKHLIRRRDQMYFRARNSSRPDIKNPYKRFRAHVQKVTRHAYWKHVSSIFTFDDDNTDPDSPQKKRKVKKFWSFVMSLKKEAFGITSLREIGILKTE